MCGICGEIRFDGSFASASRIEKMTESLAPRGPDGAGIHLHKNVGLGHRRLKIIDLSEHAHQPMVDSELGLSVVFNGCIYNYPELRKELQEKGYRFFSTGDTEVILKAYHAWGEDFVSRLYGMFAFVIVERDSGKIVAGRDRLGIKPFYYHRTKDAFRFASTLPSLLAGGGIDREINPVALHHYMTFHAVVPAPHTIVRSVHKLAPATLMIIGPQGDTRERIYWEPRYGARPEDAKLTEKDWQDRVLESLRRAVKRRLVADVPVGVLLSGGLDSSLITGLLAEAGQSGLKTFSIGFEAAGGEKGDEFEYSDIVARHFSTDHTKIFIDSSRALPALERTVANMSEPMVSHDNIGFYLLSEEVSKHVKVVQSGQGADEVFGGYHWYPKMMETSPDKAVEAYSSVFFDRDHAEFRRAVAPAYVDRDFSREFVEAHFGRPGAEAPIDKALRIDTHVMLVDDPVKRVDNNTMGWGLEARVPFLDHEVVELAATVPPELKIRGDGKYVVKEASRSVIPKEVIDRPKGYFPVPALKYIQGEYLEFVRGILDSGTARNRGLFNRAYVDGLLKEPSAHITPLRGSKLYQIAILEYWLQLHDV